MATALSGYYPTMLDMLKATDPNGDPALVVELMNQTNELLWDMPVQIGNLKTGHQTTVRTGLPTGVWSRLYQGVPPSKSGYQQVDDTAGRFEMRSEIDVRALKIQRSPEGFIANEQLPFFEAMNQQIVQNVLYNDTALNPDRFLGLSPRYPTSSMENVLSGGATGSSCSSIWLITWGPNTCFSFTPENVPGGLVVEDKGVEAVRSIAAGGSALASGTYYARVHTYEWNLGLCVRDWRYIVRAANINMASGATTNTLTLDLLVDMLGQLPTWRSVEGRPCFYMHKSLWTQLMKLAMNKSNAALGWSDVMGHKVLDFWGFPIRQVDQLLITETNI